MRRKHNAYTLWMKWRGIGWRQEFTITEHRGSWSSLEVLEHWMGRFSGSGSYFQRGKTWMIKPEGQKPAELLRQEAE